MTARSQAAVDQWLRHVLWSGVADRLKREVVRARTSVLVLSTVGAVLETLAATASAMNPLLRHGFAYAGAAALVVVPIIQSQFMKRDKLRNWTRARSASEGIKSEVCTLLAGASPYDGPDAEKLLEQECQIIAEDVSDLQPLTLRVEVTRDDHLARLVGAGYVEHRVRDQIDRFYRPKATRALIHSTRFRWIETAFSAAAAIAGAWAGLEIAEGTSSLGVWVAVLTTIAGALATHASAERFDFLATSYAATAGKLEDLLRGWQLNGTPTSGAEWSQLVKDCEDTISVENAKWLARAESKVSKPDPSSREQA